ncbi:30S ribosomal protein S8e [Candidatus Woesearchaeota archaeon]|nr:30S ribosomal protein S8e [Candidatus Woesearchaeota archaeon]
MVVFQGKGRRSSRGSRYKRSREYKKHELGRIPSLTGLEKKRLQRIRTLGGRRKLRLLSEEYANVSDKSNKAKKVKIKTTTENPANSHFVRRNIMTKGTIIDTELGKARITSRPGQDGVINAVLVK